MPDAPITTKGLSETLNELGPIINGFVATVSKVEQFSKCDFTAYKNGLRSIISAFGEKVTATRAEEKLPSNIKGYSFLAKGKHVSEKDVTNVERDKNNKKSFNI